MSRHDGRRGQPIWIADGGEGLPPYDETDKENRIWLFSCVACGKRWANPPAPVSGCSCGGEIVCHRIPADEYRRIRIHGDPRPDGVMGDG